MQKILNSGDLAEAISQLESAQAEDRIMLKEQFNLTLTGLKPINLLKSTLREAISSGELKGNILNTTIGLTAGYLAKKLLEKGSVSPVRKLFGSVLMFGITNLFSKNPEIIQVAGKKFWEAIRYKTGSNENGANITETGHSLPGAG